MSEDGIAKFLAYAPDVNITWLLTGQGPMLLDRSEPVAAASSGEPLERDEKMLERIEQLTQENARLQGKIEAQRDFIELIISKLTKNNGGGNLSGLLSAEPPTRPIDPPKTTHDIVDLR